MFFCTNEYKYHSFLLLFYEDEHKCHCVVFKIFYLFGAFACQRSVPLCRHLISLQQLDGYY